MPEQEINISDVSEGLLKKIDRIILSVVTKSEPRILDVLGVITISLSTNAVFSDSLAKLPFVVIFSLILGGILFGSTLIITAQDLIKVREAERMRDSSLNSEQIGDIVFQYVASSARGKFQFRINILVFILFFCIFMLLAYGWHFKI